MDLISEMDTAAKLHKVNALDPTLLDAATVLKMATIQGAKALRVDDIIGSLEIGKKADVTVVDSRNPHLIPVYNPASHIVYAAQGADVRDVIVNGRLLVKDRKLLTIDLENITQKVIELSKSIKKNFQR